MHLSPTSRPVTVDTFEVRHTRSECLGAQLASLDARAREVVLARADADSGLAQHRVRLAERQRTNERKHGKLDDDLVRFDTALQLSRSKQKVQRKRAQSAVDQQQRLANEAEALRESLDALRREREASMAALRTGAAPLGFLRAVVAASPEYASVDEVVEHYNDLCMIAREREAAMTEAFAQLNARKTRLRLLLQAHELEQTVQKQAVHELLGAIQTHEAGAQLSSHAKDMRAAEERNSLFAERSVRMSIKNMLLSTPYGAARSAAADMCGDMDRIADHVLYLSELVHQNV